MFLLPLVAIVFVWSASHRYRPDKRALVASIAAGLAATAGVALAIPDISVNLPGWLLTVWGCAAILVAIVGTVYAEMRLKRASVQQG